MSFQGESSSAGSCPEWELIGFGIVHVGVVCAVCFRVKVIGVGDVRLENCLGWELFGSELPGVVVIVRLGIVLGGNC